MLDGAEAGGAVPRIVHLADAAVHHGVVSHHVHLVVVIHIGGDVVFVQSLVVFNQRLVQRFHFLIGHGHVLQKQVLHLLHNGVALVAELETLGAVAVFVVVGNGLLTGGGEFFLGAFGVHILQITLDAAFPVRQGEGFQRSLFFLSELRQAEFHALLQKQRFNDGAFQRGSAEEIHHFSGAEVVVAGVLAAQAGVDGLHIGPGQLLAVDGDQQGIGGQFHGGGGGFFSGDGFLSQSGHAKQHAHAQQQGHKSLQVLHVVQRSFQAGLILWRITSHPGYYDTEIAILQGIARLQAECYRVFTC